MIARPLFTELQLQLIATRLTDSCPPSSTKLGLRLKTSCLSIAGMCIVPCGTNFFQTCVMCVRNAIAPATPRRQGGTGATAQIQLRCCPAGWRRNPGCLRSLVLSFSSMSSTCRAWASFWSRSGLSLRLAGLCLHEKLWLFLLWYFNRWYV